MDFLFKNRWPWQRHGSGRPLVVVYAENAFGFQMLTTEWRWPFKLVTTKISYTVLRYNLSRQFVLALNIYRGMQKYLTNPTGTKIK